MVRTQIYLPEIIHKRLIFIAKQKRLSMAYLIRKFIEGGLKIDQEKDTSGLKAMQGVLGMQITGGPKDLSKNLDKHLYG